MKEIWKDKKYLPYQNECLFDENEKWATQNDSPWPEEWLYEKDIVEYKKTQNKIIKKIKAWQAKQQ